MIIITEKDIETLEYETGLHFDEIRRQALMSFEDVQACPGSGKTTLIAAKLILLAKKWEYKFKGVCVLSHTNVAKNEIIQKLENHPQARMFLGYPHFIGTIQEFINKFVAIPVIRSRGWNVSSILSDDDFSVMVRKLRWKKFTDLKTNKPYSFSYYLNSKKINARDMRIIFNGSELVIYPGFIDRSKSYISSSDHKELNHCIFKKRKEMIDKGIFTYHEMYEISKYAVIKLSDLPLSISYRFPCVFMDEMQDTSLLQDEVIGSIFTGAQCNIQRFGDPDQAIFDGNEAPNESYNSSDNKVINKSHRFCPSIANLVSGLSHKGLEIESSRTESYGLPHTIFLVDEKSRHKVIPAFAEKCKKNLPQDYTDAIKVVGAIGIPKPDGLTICSYFSEFDKTKSLEHFKPSRFIQCFSCSDPAEGSHSGQTYKRVLEGIVHCARLGGRKLLVDGHVEHQYTVETIKRFLKYSGFLHDFNLQYLKIFHSQLLDQNFWTDECVKLLELVNLDGLAGDALDFISYEFPQIVPPENKNKRQLNKLSIATSNGEVDIEVATIHGVKGETHAATLVLETKFSSSFDIYGLLENLLKIDKKPVSTIQKKKFMKQLYVAVTRPRYLLCIAMDKSRITNNQKEIAENLGWNIVELN